MPTNSGMRCLIVDDEPRLRRVLVRLLESEGFSCAEAGSGVEALEELERTPAPLVISDLRMPELDGVTLLREIVARWPDTAVIMVTGVADVESAVACLQMGALDYVAKPFHLDEVRARVSQALDRRRLLIENRSYQKNLEERVAAQAHRIEELFLEGVHALVYALEAKDAYTRGHWQWLSGWLERRRDSLRGTARQRRRCVRRDDERPSLPALADREAGHARAGRGANRTVRRRDGGGLPPRLFRT